MYQVLLYVHIICAVIWVGGAFFSQLLALRVERSTDPTDLPKLGRNMEFLGLRVFLPASILLVLAGAAMVAQQWGFGQTWVAVSMGLWLVSVIAYSWLAPDALLPAAFFGFEFLGNKKRAPEAPCTPPEFGWPQPPPAVRLGTTTIRSLVIILRILRLEHPKGCAVIPPSPRKSREGRL